MPWFFNCSIKVAHKEGLRYIKFADWFISMNPTDWKKLSASQTANQTLQIRFHQPCATEDTRSPAAEGFVHKAQADLLLFPPLLQFGKGPNSDNLPLFSCLEDTAISSAQAELGEVYPSAKSSFLAPLFGSYAHSALAGYKHPPQLQMG